LLGSPHPPDQGFEIAGLHLLACQGLLERRQFQDRREDRRQEPMARQGLIVELIFNSCKKYI